MTVPRSKSLRPAVEEGAVEILARTIYGEARGEPVRAKEAMANVVMNRVRRGRRPGGYWWGDTVATVCYRPGQFPCWDEGSRNRQKIQSVTKENRVFASCLRIARRAVAGTLEDITFGSTHYHAKSVNPPWSCRRGARVEIGKFLFYNNVE